MKRIAGLIILILTVCCQGKIAEADIQNLNGYWEISFVRFADGSKKDFKVNETVDYFKIDGMNGTRKKVKPQFDGTYLESGAPEKFEIASREGKTLITYQTEFQSWTEEIITLDKDEFAVRNPSNVEYYYKRAIPFNLK